MKEATVAAASSDCILPPLVGLHQKPAECLGKYLVIHWNRKIHIFFFCFISILPPSCIRHTHTHKTQQNTFYGMLFYYFSPSLMQCRTVALSIRIAVAVCYYSHTTMICPMGRCGGLVDCMRAHFVFIVHWWRSKAQAMESLSCEFRQFEMPPTRVWYLLNSKYFCQISGAINKCCQWRRALLRHTRTNDIQFPC